MMNCGICNQEMEHINDIGLRCMNCDLDQEPIKIELTYKRESKELETALAVVRCLINDSKNCIKANEDDKHMKKQFKSELHQLYGVENLLECADFYYED